MQLTLKEEGEKRKYELLIALLSQGIIRQYVIIN